MTGKGEVRCAEHTGRWASFLPHIFRSLQPFLWDQLQHMSPQRLAYSSVVIYYLFFCIEYLCTAYPTQAYSALFSSMYITSSQLHFILKEPLVNLTYMDYFFSVWHLVCIQYIFDILWFLSLDRYLLKSWYIDGKMLSFAERGLWKRGKGLSWDPQDIFNPQQTPHWIMILFLLFAGN